MYLSTIRRPRFGALLVGVVTGLLSWTTLSAEDDYRLGLGDQVSVQVLGEAEFSGVFAVGSDGAIDYPYLRKVGAKDLSTSELAEKLGTLLKDGYLVNPQVLASVQEYRSQRVLVLGAVTKPGTYILRGATRILDMISQAGGLSAVGGKQILLLRDVKGTSEAAGVLAEPPPARPKTDAKTPKPAISEGDGPAELPAGAAAVFSTSKPLVVDYHRLVQDGDLTQNLLLRDGDVLNVPKADEILIFGNVARPGPVKYEDNMTILQAVTLAGGPTPEASTKATYILRRTSKGEEKISVRLDKILDNKAANIRLKANDVVVVPESFF